MSTLADYSVACKAWYSEGLANLSDVENLHVFRIKDNEVADNQPLGDISMKEAIAGGFVDRIPTEEADAWIAAHGSRNIGRGNIVRVSNNNVLAEIFNNDEDSEESASTFVLVKKIEENESVSWRPLACAHLSMDLYHGKPRYVSFTFIGTNKFMRVEFDPNASALYHDLHKFFENRELFTITLGAYKGDESWIRNSLECTEFYKVKLYGSAVNGKSDDDEDMGAPDENNPECRLSIGGDFDESGYTHVMLEAVGVTGKNGILCHQGKEMRCICPVVGGKLVNVDLTEVLYQWVQTAPEEGDPAVANAPDVVIIRGYGMRVVSGSGNNGGGDDSGLVDIDYGWVIGQTNLLGDDPHSFGADGIDGRLHSTMDFIAKGYLKRDPSLNNPQDALTSKTDESNSLKHFDSIKICACNKERTKFLVKQGDTFYFLDDDAVAYKNSGNTSNAEDTLYEHVYVSAPNIQGDDITLDVCNFYDSDDGMGAMYTWLVNHSSDRKTFQIFNGEAEDTSIIGDYPLYNMNGDSESDGYGDKDEEEMPPTLAEQLAELPPIINPVAILGVYKKQGTVIGYLIQGETFCQVVSSKVFSDNLLSDNTNGSAGWYVNRRFGQSAVFDTNMFLGESSVKEFIVPMLRRYAGNGFNVTYYDNPETSTYGTVSEGKELLTSIGVYRDGNVEGIQIRPEDEDSVNSEPTGDTPNSKWNCTIQAKVENVTAYVKVSDSYTTKTYNLYVTFAWEYVNTFPYVGYFVDGDTNPRSGTLVCILAEEVTP